MVLQQEVRFPIGVFDSGVGGLTVLQEVHRQLRYESVVYFGDTARLPYGMRFCAGCSLNKSRWQSWLVIPVRHWR